MVDKREDQQRVSEWHRKRWPECHPLRILAKAMSEMGELADAILGLEENTTGKGNVNDELGDCLITLYALADRLNVDLLSAGMSKFDEVVLKHPAPTEDDASFNATSRPYSITKDGHTKNMIALMRRGST